MQTDCYPISTLPGLNRLFLDYTASREPMTPFFPASPCGPHQSAPTPAQQPALRAAVADLLREQNQSFGAGAKTFENIERLRTGTGAIVTGQQVTLFGGPLFTLHKIATAIRKAQDTDSVPVFWLASEDHDLAEADHLTLPSRHQLHTLRLESGHSHAGQPVGGIRLGAGIEAVLDKAAELIGGTPEFDLLAQCYRSDATFARAFAQWAAATFAAYGLVVIDAADPRFHALGAPVFRQAIEQAAALESALHIRDQELKDRGYHSQVLVAPGSSLLFLIEEANNGEEAGARLALKRKDAQIWTAGKRQYETAELLALLDRAPHRFSPNALLRPVFQDYLLPTRAYIGGPSEIAYFAQSQVLYQAILGRFTPIVPRLSATLIEPAVATVLAQHELDLQQIIATHPDELAQRLGARAIPIEGKKKLASAGNALDEELTSVTAWMQSLDHGLGRSAEIAARKMRYQMNRLRRLAANYQLQKESSIRRHVDALYLNLFPNHHPQERVIGGVAYLARYGDALLSTLVEQAAQECPGHKVIYL
ncbi:bacillithiol biosynthesis cysteine-adding enzyme BshC [Paracidobacterium acidisoli]|uniref:Putative cysteine ligase BshC n=1 Tax=Paracidobacterium acidisoli TaxID=2303751 RepID=A0A372IUK7_9BACT|nr:bacillithiol biosynthesis cysteine-adding enzyme BshC [Paracidobacterium acidisoli]